MTFSFHPEAEEDLLAGINYYEECREGLGYDFAREVYAAIHNIIKTPKLWPELEKDVRRRLLRRFPYAIYFKVEDDRVIVFGSFHCARNPGFIQDSLGTRNQLI